MVFQTWNYGKKKKKESNSIVLDQSLLLYADIVFKLSWDKTDVSEMPSDNWDKL